MKVKKLIIFVLILTVITIIVPFFSYKLNIFAQDLSDLDVTYIERTPRYYHYNITYPWPDELPVHSPMPNDPDQNPDNDKLWPSSGEQVTFTAHIINKGVIGTGTFDYKWYIDGVLVKSGTHIALAHDEEGTETYVWTWPENLNDHTVKFEVDPNNTITEVSENNNQLTEYTNSLSFKIWAETGIYNIFNQTLNGVGSYSFEDWIQWQLSTMKGYFLASKYPVAPQGIKDRIRIDKIVIGNQLDQSGDGQGACNPVSPMTNDPDQYTIDGRWQFVDNDCTNAKGQNNDYQRYVTQFAGQIDGGLIHELAHQLGIIDLYRMNIANDPGNHYRFQVTDLNGNLIDPLPLLPIFPRDGIMGGGDISPYRGNYFESHTVGGMNSNYLYRRGSYGDYLYDTPENNYMKFINSDGEPLVGAEIKLYQKSAGAEVFDNIPEITGTTDNEGKIFLTNRPAPSVLTVTGHRLKNNPFGKIDVAGTNGTMFVKITKSGQENYRWFTITELNLAYWKGDTQAATYTINTNIGSCPNESFGNINCDDKGIIDETDLNIMLNYWDPNGPIDEIKKVADLTKDNKIDNNDKTILLRNWRTLP